MIEYRGIVVVRSIEAMRQLDLLSSWDVQSLHGDFSGDPAVSPTQSYRKNSADALYPSRDRRAQKQH